MIVEQIWTGNAYLNLDYLIACPETGEALAVDSLDHEKCLKRAKTDQRDRTRKSNRYRRKSGDTHLLKYRKVVGVLAFCPGILLILLILPGYVGGRGHTRKVCPPAPAPEQKTEKISSQRVRRYKPGCRARCVSGTAPGHTRI